MNAFYVIVSIPLLLVLAGFNHAHGLTTFGKTSNTPNNNQPTTPTKPCVNHVTCEGIIGTSCVPDPRDHSKMGCLCGNNQPPINANCQTNYRGPKHLCANTPECVENAECLPTKNGQEKTCQCMEGYISNDNMCSGAFQISASFSGIVLLLLLSVFWNNYCNLQDN